MEGAIWAIAGVLVLVLLVAFTLTVPNFLNVPPATMFKGFYERYVDSLVISASAALSLLALGLSMGIVLSRGTMKDTYILASMFLLAIKSLLLLIDTLSNTPQTWLVSSTAHLFDLAIIGFLVMALRETS